jgi:hypothetical protein
MQIHLPKRFQPLHGLPRAHSKEERLHLRPVIPHHRHAVLLEQADPEANRKKNPPLPLPLLRIQDHPQ